MALGSPGYEGGPSWSVDDIPYHALAYDQVRDDQRLFHILASASFIEITSDLYTRNLVEFFQDDREVVEWLERRWEREELQHGAALKRYVQTAWPDFDWEAAYKLFFAEYSQCCTVEQLAGTRALEMAARCVVETGTATFYRMMSELSREPVLKRLAAEISADEVRHYKHFYRYFQRYRSVEQPSRVSILRTLLNRAAEVEAEDAFYAFKAVFQCLQSRRRVPEKRLCGLSRRRHAAHQEPLSARHGGEDAAEAARPQSHGRARDVAGHHVGHAAVPALLGRPRDDQGSLVPERRIGFPGSKIKRRAEPRPLPA